jgi:glycosyltransferase involved in cell wall biosynthesis
MRIRVFATFTQTGIGTHAKNVLDFLGKVQSSTLTVEAVSIFDADQVRQAIQSSSIDDINIHLFPDSFASQLKGKKFYWAVFESTRPPPAFMNWFELFDHVLSPSNWGRDCMIRWGAPGHRITVIPEGVDPWIYHPYVPRDANRKPRFLMVGKYETRKGYEVALEAFAIAHTRNPNMELWLKPDWIDGVTSAMHVQFARISQSYAELPISMVQGILTIDQMKILYREASCFLFPSLCEGWGLPLIEALASGIPAIACSHGGQSEFLKAIDGNYISIPYSLEAITCPQWQHWYQHSDGNWGEWAKIDPKALAELMLDFVQTDFQARARVAANTIRKEFSWERSVDALLEFIFFGSSNSTATT